MMRLLKRLLSVVRDRAKVMVDLDKTGRELDKRSPARRRSLQAVPQIAPGLFGGQPATIVEIEGLKERSWLTFSREALRWALVQRAQRGRSG